MIFSRYSSIFTMNLVTMIKLKKFIYNKDEITQNLNFLVNYAFNEIYKNITTVKLIFNGPKTKENMTTKDK